MGREGGKVEPGGIARYGVNAECGEHVGSLTVVVWSSWQACNRRCLYFANSGVCGVAAVLDTAVRCAWLGLVGLARGSACWLGEDVTGQFGAKGPLVGPGDL